MIRTRRERFHPDQPLVAIKPLTVNGEPLQPGDDIPMSIPVGLRKKMWKARRCVHKGSRLDGKIITKPGESVTPVDTPTMPEPDADAADTPTMPEPDTDAPAMPVPPMPTPPAAPAQAPEPEAIGAQWGYPDLSDEKHRSKKKAREWWIANAQGV